MKLLVRRYSTPWRPMARYACVPSLQCGVVAGAWLGLWVFFVIGAAVLMAIENPTRRSDAAVALGQSELTFIQGFGDVIPLTPGGRAFVSLWSVFGTALWLMFLTTLVSYMGDWVYVNLVLNAWWHLRQAKRGGVRSQDACAANGNADDSDKQSASEQPCADASGRAGSEEGDGVASLATDISSGVSSNNDMELDECGEGHNDNDNGGECDDDEDDEGGKADVEMATAKEKEKKKKKNKKTKATGWDDLVESRSVQDEVLSWYTLSILNVCALVLYFATHLLGAGVLYALEPDLGNRGPSLTPVTFGNVFYVSLMASQTIYYNPKTSSGRTFFLVWHQFALISSAFLFVTVLLALLRWTKCRLFAVTEKVVRKTHGLALRHSQLRRSGMRSSSSSSSSPSSTPATSAPHHRHGDDTPDEVTRSYEPHEISNIKNRI